MAILSDLELIKKFQSGDQKAFEELIQRYTPKVYSMTSRLVLNPEDTEEVLQDVFVTVYRKIGGFEGKSSFSSWLYRVAVNTSLMKLRKRRQNKNLALEDVLPDFDNSVILRNSELEDTDTVSERRRLSDAIEEAIKRLPDEYRPVFVLRDIDGLTSREVAKMLRLSIPAVKSRLHRSRSMLRRRLLPLYREYAGDAVPSRSARAGGM